MRILMISAKRRLYRAGAVDVLDALLTNCANAAEISVVTVLSGDSREQSGGDKRYRRDS